MRNLYDIIFYPLITEKSTLQAEQRKYAFRVHPEAAKGDIKLAVEKAFKVKVEKINTLRVPGKLKRVRFQAGYTSEWKKAIVTLKSGHKIEFTP